MVARRTGRFPQLVDPRSSVNGLLLTGSPRFRGVKPRRALSMRQAALSQEPQGAADELVQIAEVAYREGEVGILELLDAIRTASRARTRNIDLRRDARLAQIALERAVGDPLWS